MSEINALRNAIRAERTLAKTEKVAARAHLEATAPPKNIVKTATGNEVDISRGYNVKGPDGVKIPFNRDTPLEKAKQWTTNFYRNDFEVKPIEAVDDEEMGLLAKFTLKPKKDDGVTRLDFDKDRDGYRIRFSKVAEKGTGVGAGMYRSLFERARKEGVKVFSDSGMSDESIAVWRRFKQLGYPITEHPHGRVPGRQYKMRSDKKPEEDAPIFEFDPSKMPGAEKVRGADKLEKEIYSSMNALKKRNVDPEVRNKITGLYLDYAMAEGAEKEALAAKIQQQIADIPEQSTVKIQKMEPGLYFDEDSKSYVQVGEDGSIVPAKLDETR